MTRAGSAWVRPLLGLCPVAIALLWLHGVARFRGYELLPVEWAVVVAAGFTLHLLTGRLWRRRPAPELPPDANPALLAALAAAIVAALAAVVGGLFEWAVEPHLPSDTPLWLRTTWHAACVFGASYCALLARLHGPRPSRPG